MPIDFEVEPDFQAKLDWIDEFMKTEVEPLDLYFRRDVSPYDKSHETAQALVRPLQQTVRDQGLWACHIGPELGGKGYGQVKLALMNELLGRSSWAPSVFGCQAPDSGNAEILAHYGTEEQKRRYLQPLLNSEISSTYSMTEPQAGADPGEFTCRAHRDGDEWVINGEKWYASNYRYASFLIVMVITNPDVPVYKGSSMILVPQGTPGLEVVRNVGLAGEEIGEGEHAYLRFTDCRVPAENLLGDEGSGFKIAQTRLGGGRIHHGMRSVGMAQRALDMMCERVLSRRTKGSLIAEKQAIQHWIADSWIQIQQFRLQVLHTAWLIDKEHDYAKIRQHIAGVKVATPKVLIDVVYRAMHAHGSLGVSNEMPLVGMWNTGPIMGIADGPTEVHKDTIAKTVLKGYQPAPGLFPTEHIPARIEAARAHVEARIEAEIAELVIPLDGPFYDELAVGDELPRQPAITVDGGLAALHQAIVGERLPLTLDAELCAAVTGRPERLVSPGLLLHLSIGQSTTISRRAIANLFYRDVRIVRPVHLGETVATVVTVAGLADGSAKPGRAPRGKVLVDIVTTAAGQEAVRYQRCPMLPQAGGDTPGHADDLGGVGELDVDSWVDLVPAGWDLAPLGPGRDWAVGETVVDPTRDVVDGATALVRLTHNLAWLHRDAAASPYPQRLVYGGHVVGLAQASLSRVVPGLATVLGWHGCDHTGPAFEGDLLSFRHTLVAERPVPGTGPGRVLVVRVEGHAHREPADGIPEAPEPAGGGILDWTVVVLAP